MEHTALDQIKERLASAPPPTNQLVAITARPETNQRIRYQSCELTCEAGLPQDRWIKHSWVRLPDGSSDPAVQISLISTALIRAIEPDSSRWPLTGDNLIVDTDLSFNALPIGSHLKIGEAILEMTQVPHTGCAIFKERFGEAAFIIVNATAYADQALRGRHAKVIQAGTITLGDLVEKHTATSI